MKKLIHTSLITLTLISTAGNASESPEAGMASQNGPSYACRVMLERGSEMFCQKDRVLAFTQEKSHTLGAMKDVAKAEISREAAPSNSSKL